jgi:hypothetical protein
MFYPQVTYFVVDKAACDHLRFELHLVNNVTDPLPKVAAINILLFAFKVL